MITFHPAYLQTSRSKKIFLADLKEIKKLMN